MFDLETAIATITQLKREHKQLCHASNILKKYSSLDKAGKLNSLKGEALKRLIPAYATYADKILKLSIFTKEDVYKSVEFLNEYYNFIHNNELDNTFSAQGKFRSTILEEYIFMLFRGYVEKIKQEYDSNGVIDSGATKAYSNLYFKAKNMADFINSPIIGVNEKDQDYAIFRKFSIVADQNKKLRIHIPALAVEAKTYIDKTMLDSIIATAEKIKTGNPHARFVAVAESYDVSHKVDPAYSRIDQIYIFRKTSRKGDRQDIAPDTVWRFFSDTITHLQRPWFDIESRMTKEGTII